ncbi:hypothetical protein Patl1_23290 [Pistacia atlantica]|uniref:Uncharacterized protein n=1 Tax=Pistacia atlantica TaxID=434234 RepID=A0ACC0ZW23_9ROSI|nr:hypothetical protein Patl1_23290 [Pistacia atlantica]
MLKWESWYFPSMSNEAIEEIFPCLKHLTLQNCPKLIEKLPTQIPSLKKLSISECPRLKCSLKGLSSLVELDIEKCNEDPLRYVAHLPSLTRLKSKSISELTSLPAFKFMALEVLQIESCPKLKCLLEELDIEDCRSFESWNFPNGKLPTMLKSLKIHCCRSLQYLPEVAFENDTSSNMSQLEKLEIVDCPSLTYLGTEKLLYCLKRLRISYCLKFEKSLEKMLRNNASLEYIDISRYVKLSSFPECLQDLSNLTEININSCPHLEFFPETGLPVSSLRTFCISNCESLKSLPNQMHEVMALRNLTITDCASSHSSVEIAQTSLRELRISGECSEDITSFPVDEDLLPRSLISLCIGRFKNLSNLSRGLNSLTLLEELEIINCSKLQSLPWDCLPASLGRLNIMDCPLLRQLFKAKRANRHVTARIPCVEVDGDCIQ